jgi:hypothetical protein
MGELRLHCARHIISECVTWTDPYTSDSFVELIATPFILLGMLKNNVTQN